MIDILRYVSIAGWLLLFLVVSRPVYRLCCGASKPLDTVWGCVFFGCINRLSFTLVALYLPHSPDALIICYVMAIMVCFATIAAILTVQRSNDS